MILSQFAGFVQKNRPGLDVASVATGETWFGEAALERGLCDEIKPVDDVLLKYVDLGYNVYEIAYRPPPAVPQGLLTLLPVGTQGSENQPMGRRIIRWLVNVVTEEVKAAIMDDSPEKRYMAKDDIADRVQVKD
jgi:ClpP class serine protease